MRLHYLRHVPYEGLGFIEPWVRRAGFKIEQTRLYTGAPFPATDEYDWLIVLGGPMGVCDADHYPWLAAELQYLETVLATDKPVLGICLGAQLLASVLGAQVRRHRHPEIGWHRLEPTSAGAGGVLEPFFAPGIEIMQWHYDTFDVPEGAVRLCRSQGCENQAFAWGDSVLGLQFHPEITYEEAAIILERDGTSAPGEYAQPGERILDEQRFGQLERATAAFLDGYAASLAW